MPIDRLCQVSDINILQLRKHLFAIACVNVRDEHIQNCCSLQTTEIVIFLPPELECITFCVAIAMATWLSVCLSR